MRGGAERTGWPINGDRHSVEKTTDKVYRHFNDIYIGTNNNALVKSRSENFLRPSVRDGPKKSTHLVAIDNRI